MLEITILKVMHHGLAEAKKLLPHIQECDVFAPEFMGTSEQQARDYERSWEKVLTWTRSRFQKHQEIAYTRHDPEARAYGTKMDDYLFRSQRPIWLVERFGEEQGRLIIANTYAKSIYAHDRDLLTRVLQGDETVCESMRRVYLKPFKAFDQRDRHIATNLLTAEARIRKRYSSLISREPLKLTVMLGVLHIPERYLQLPCRVVDLTPLELTPEERLTQQLYQSGRWQTLSNEDLQDLARVRLGIIAN